MRSRFVRHSIRVYRLLLWCYPADHRRDYGDLMAQLFADMCRDTHQHRGTGGMVILWLRTAFDLIITATQEHLLAIGYRRAKAMDATTFEGHVKDLTQTMIVKLREGYSIRQIIEHFRETGEAPVAGEFDQVLQDLDAGMPFMKALNHMQERVDSEKFGRVIDVMIEQRRIEGNLANMLEDIIDEL